MALFRCGAGSSNLLEGKTVQFGYSTATLSDVNNTITSTTNGNAFVVDIKGKGYTSLAHTLPTPSRGPNSIGFILEDGTCSMVQHDSAGTVTVPSNANYCMILIALNASDNRTFTFS